MIVGIYVIATIVFLATAFVLTLLAKTLPIHMRVPFCTLVYTLLFTPSVFVGGTGAGGGVFLALPIPFGGHIIFLLTGDTEFGGIVNLILETWFWHIPAFIIIGLISYKLARKFVGNKINESSNHT